MIKLSFLMNPTRFLEIRSMNKNILAPLFAVLLTSFAGSLRSAENEALPVISDKSGPFSFVVVGDLHYSASNSAPAKDALAGIVSGMKDAQPPVSLVCMTGDIAHGEQPGNHKQLSPTDMKAELSEVMGTLKQQFQLPIFVAVGNHDKHARETPYREVVLPFLAKELGIPSTPEYYAFRYGSACFIFLDYGDYRETKVEMDYPAQERFLTDAIVKARATPGIEHVFLFGHYPLWPVMRVGFGNLNFTNSVVRVITQHPVDAYFCGHTHNTGVWVRDVDGVPITQIKGVAMDRTAELEPLETKRAPLIPLKELRYGWGNVSGPPSGFYLIRVEGPKVNVQLRSGSEVLREFEWTEPGKIADRIVKQPKPAALVKASAQDLRSAVSGKLILTAWTEDDVISDVSLNGTVIGQLRLKRIPDYAAFKDEIAIEIPAAVLAGLKHEDTVVFSNLGRNVFGVGNLRLELHLKDGRTVSSAVFPDYLLSADREEVITVGKNPFVWNVLPKGIVSTVRLGQPLSPAKIAFAIP